MGLTGPLFLWSAFKLHTKDQIWRYPLSTLNQKMYCKERHPLLMKYFKTFDRYILKLGRALQSIKHLQAIHWSQSHHAILHRCWLSNCTQNDRLILPFIMANEIFYRGERHLLLMKCFKSLLGYTRRIWGVTESISKPRMGLIMPFYWDPISNYTQNTRFSYPIGTVNGTMYYK